MKINFILGIGIVFSTVFAQATVLDVCDLAKTPVEGNAFLQLSSGQIKSYKDKLAKECDLSSKFKSLNEKLFSVYKISLTDIAEYQAIRFVQRSWLAQAEIEQKPVEIIYQIFKGQYALPFSQQSGAIWDDWAVGIQQLEPVIESFKKGESFDLKALKEIHRGLFPFYPMVDEHGEFAHEPNPGVLKPTITSDSEGYWWILETPAEISSAQTIVKNENELYKSLGLITPAPKGLAQYVSDILNVREGESRDGSKKVMALYSGSDSVNRQNIELILGMVDSLMKQARSGQHMVWKNTLFTPGQLAYFVQQAYVRVHPFYEGNGRTSRFLQELILSAFNMPHGASGDLMDIDALTESGEYYEKAIEASFALIRTMRGCSDEYEQVSRRKDIRLIDQSRLSYGCRVLADRSSVWADMKNKNEVVNKSNYDQSLARLAALDQQTDQNHLRELAIRRGVAPAPAAVPEAGAALPQQGGGAPSTAADPSLECKAMIGAEKDRCERFAEIRKRIGK